MSRRILGTMRFDMGNDSLYIPSIPWGHLALDPNRRDHPGVLTADCDRGVATRDFWNEARREIVIHLYCNRPDKKAIDAAIQRHQERHGEVTGVTIYVDPAIYRDLGQLFTLWGFDRSIAREHPKVPYFVLTRATAKKIPDRPTPEESEADRKLREAKMLVRSGRATIGI
jgi:hypothetical protein